MNFAKPAVSHEMFRVLKPGGRVGISDIALKKPLPEELADNLLAYVGCISGATPIAIYEQGPKNAGSNSVTLIDTKKVFASMHCRSRR